MILVRHQNTITRFVFFSLTFVSIIFFANAVFARKIESERSAKLQSSYSSFSQVSDCAKADLNCQSWLLDMQWDWVVAAPANQAKDFWQDVRFELYPRFRTDTESHDTAEKNIFSWRELALTIQTRASSRLKIGYSLLNWEGTDFVNPIDVMNMTELQDPLASEKKSPFGFYFNQQWALRGESSVNWDVVYIPVQNKSSLPGEHSLWWPRKINFPLQTEQFTLQLPDQVSYRVLRDDELNHALSQNIGTRFNLRTSASEWSLAAKEGAHSTPLLLPVLDVSLVSLSPKLVFLLQSPVKVQPVYYRERQLAAGFNYYWDSLIFRSAAVHTQPLGEDSRIPSYSDQNVLSLEKTFNFSFRSLPQNLTVMLERIETKHATGSAASENTSTITNIFDQSWVMGWRWPFSEKWTWNSALLQEQKKKSNYVHQSLQWKINDHWQQDVTADIFSGADDAPLGIYDQNDRYQISWLFSF